MRRNQSPQLLRPLLKRPNGPCQEASVSSACVVSRRRGGACQNTHGWRVRFASNEVPASTLAEAAKFWICAKAQRNLLRSSEPGRSHHRLGLEEKFGYQDHPGPRTPATAYAVAISRPGTELHY